MPGLSKLAQIRTEDPFALPSSMIFPKHVLALATRVRQLFAADAGLAGIVVTQGTDSLEEVSFLLDLLVDDPRPVVFTGAMRLPGQLGDDGARNLLNAVRLAISPAARDLGVLVTMNDEVHAAREIRKTDSTQVEAFTSPSGGPIARFDDADLFLMRRPARRISLGSTTLEPRVDLVHVAIGSDGHLVEAAVEAAPRGWCSSCLGAPTRVPLGTSYGVPARRGWWWSR
ncbi:MAG: hypothetical protein HC897_04480 [Thermoanaerobaculia bacterium]|nr:hypothetical protein [Thermoanaerobaculia bacterium]